MGSFFYKNYKKITKSNIKLVIFFVITTVGLFFIVFYFCQKIINLQNNRKRLLTIQKEFRRIFTIKLFKSKKLGDSLKLDDFFRFSDFYEVSKTT